MLLLYFVVTLWSIHLGGFSCLMLNFSCLILIGLNSKRNSIKLCLSTRTWRHYVEASYRVFWGNLHLLLSSLFFICVLLGGNNWLGTWLLSGWVIGQRWPPQSWVSRGKTTVISRQYQPLRWISQHVHPLFFLSEYSTSVLPLHPILSLIIISKLWILISEL